jgi:hypothetical protein
VGSSGNGDCARYDVPLASTPDLSAPFTLITPNLCHDGHSNSCSGSSDPLKQSNDWLSTFVPKLMASPQYQARNTVIFITWDEANGTCGCATTPPDNKIATIIIDPFAGNHDTSAAAQGRVYRHWSMLQYAEDTFGLPHLGPSVPSLGGHFGLPVPGTASVPTNTGKPVISGASSPPVAGNVLTTSNGTWTNSPTSYRYRWVRCNTFGFSCTAINGYTYGTSNRYTIQSADVGHTLRSVVEACNSSGCRTAGSAPTATVQ